MEYVGLGRILKGVVFAGLVFLFVRNRDHLSYTAAMYVAGIVSAAAVLFVIYHRKFGRFRGPVNFSRLKRIGVSAFPLAAGSFITQINYNFGTVALGLFLTDEIVGLFSASYKIVLFIWAFAVVAASNAVLPLLARSVQNFNHGIQRFPEETVSIVHSHCRSFGDWRHSSRSTNHRSFVRSGVSEGSDRASALHMGRRLCHLPCCL